MREAQVAQREEWPAEAPDSLQRIQQRRVSMHGMCRQLLFGFRRWSILNFPVSSSFAGGYSICSLVDEKRILSCYVPNRLDGCISGLADGIQGGSEVFGFSKGIVLVVDRYSENS